MKVYFSITMFFILVGLLNIKCQKSGNDANNNPGYVPNLVMEVDSITKNSARLGGIIFSVDASFTVTTAKGFCYSTSSKPTTSNTVLNVPNNLENFYATATGLTPSTKYYVRPYVIYSGGTIYGNEVNFTTLAPFVMGEKTGGGVVFYIDASGLHGLIRSPDYDAYKIWGCDGVDIKGTSTDIGTGQANTTAILNSCKNVDNAAKYCADLTLNGFDDWFLPSRDELERLCESTSNNNRFFWSSSQKDNSTAYFKGFENCNNGGSFGAYFKKSQEWVWPVRKF